MRRCATGGALLLEAGQVEEAAAEFKWAFGLDARWLNRRDHVAPSSGSPRQNAAPSRAGGQLLRAQAAAHHRPGGAGARAAGGMASSNRARDRPRSPLTLRQKGEITDRSKAWRPQPQGLRIRGSWRSSPESDIDLLWTLGRTSSWFPAGLVLDLSSARPRREVITRGTRPFIRDRVLRRQFLMKDDAVYLRHILECIRRIEEDTAAGRAAFMGSTPSKMRS
jgi:hypothetical protein